VFGTVALASLLFGGAMLPVAASSAALSKLGQNTQVGKLVATLHDPAAARFSDDEYGSSMAVSGKTLVVGADGANAFLGSTQIYAEGASGWPKLPATTLYDPAQTFDDLFGESVAVAGKTVVVSAPGEGTSPGVVYVYVRDDAGWPTTPTVTLPNRAISVAVSGTTIVVGGPYGAYIYAKGATGWPTTPTATLPDPAATPFGSSVAVSGRTVVIGAQNSAYIYVKGSAGWPTTPTATLPDPAAPPGDQFGGAVAVSGTTAIISAPGYNSSAGAAYVYTKCAKGWPTTPTATLQDPERIARDNFGNSVALSGKAIIVGAYGTDPGGAAYIYAKGVTGWPTTPTVTLLAAAYMAPGTPAGGSFGFAAAVSKRTAIISAQGYNPGLGAAYIYKA
jgi:FG-GAP repeat